jgi:hypothetical protein
MPMTPEQRKQYNATYYAENKAKIKAHEKSKYDTNKATIMARRLFLKNQREASVKVE